MNTASENENGTGWRTPSKAEFDYILYTRGNNLWGQGEVNGHTGLIILPDDWTLPEGLTFKSAETPYSYSDNVYTSSEWGTMQDAGAVFLPGAGTRDGYTVNIHATTPSGQYWTNNGIWVNYGYIQFFSSGSIGNRSNSLRHVGNAVRLVKDVPSSK